MESAGFLGTLSLLAGLTSFGFFIAFLYSLFDGQVLPQYLVISLVALILNWVISYLDDGVNPITGKRRNSK